MQENSEALALDACETNVQEVTRRPLWCKNGNYKAEVYAEFVGSA